MQRQAASLPTLASSSLFWRFNYFNDLIAWIYSDCEFFLSRSSALVCKSKITSSELKCAFSGDKICSKTVEETTSERLLVILNWRIISKSAPLCKRSSKLWPPMKAPVIPRHSQKMSPWNSSHFSMPRIIISHFDNLIQLVVVIFLWSASPEPHYSHKCYLVSSKSRRTMPHTNRE